MLSQFVGMVDGHAALVLVAAFAAGAAVFMTCVICFVVKRRSRQMVDNDFELAKIKERNENERTRYQFETNRITSIKKFELDHDVELRKVNDGMITSHRSNG